MDAWDFSPVESWEAVNGASLENLTAHVFGLLFPREGALLARDMAKS